MANFNVTTLLGYSVKKEYTGIFNYRNVVTLTVETLHRTNTDPRYDLGTLNEYDAPDIYKHSNTPIVLNDTPFGVGRIVSISEPRSENFDQNGLKFWKRIITFEIYEIGDSSNLPTSTPETNNFFNRLKETIFNPRIISLSETFSFSDAEDSNLGYTQIVSVSCADEIAEGSPSDNTKTGIYLARQIAQTLIESEVNFGFIGNLNALYQKEGKKTYSTEVDPINGSVSITKNFRAFLFKTPASYSFEVNDDGSINISESISILNQNAPIKINDVGGIVSVLDNIKNSSYARCLAYFNAYKPLIQLSGGNQVDGLTSEAQNLISVQRTFNEGDQQYSQIVTFSNARNLRSYYVLEIDQNLTTDENGFVNINETGSFVAKKTKVKNSDSSFLSSNFFASGVSVKTSIDTEQSNSLTRAVALYKKSYPNYSIEPSLKLARSLRNCSIRGKSFGYTVTYTNDPSLLKANDINTINSKLEVVLPKQIANSYILPQNKNVFIQYREQSSVGEMKIAQTCIIKRTDSNKTPNLVSKPTSIIRTMYNNCLLSLLNRLNSFGGGDPNNFIIKSVSFSYNSSREVKVDVAIDYLLAANRAGPNKNLYLN